MLRKLVHRGKSTAFGRDHGFSHIRSYKDFAERIPIRGYDELRPYVERVVRGESEALLPSGERVLMFAMTSGTTNHPKYVPVTPAFVREYRRGWNVFGVKALLDHPDGFLRPILQVVSPMDESRTDSGVACGAISGLLAATAKKLVRKFYVNPPLTGRIEDPEARYYTIMRFAVPRDVSWVVTPNPATTLKLAESAAEHVESLIRDIRDGTLNPPGEAPQEVLTALRSQMRPDPQTARRLESLMDRRGELLPRDYWRLAFLANWTGGTLGLHLREFPRYFDDTPVRDMGLLATEGRVSIPFRDGDPGGVLDVEGSFFEFLDAEADASDPHAVHRAHEVRVGGEYRVVMTTYAGFTRYDLEDRIRVTGFLGEAPIVEFLHRGPHVCSITGEKITEWQVTEAFRLTCEAVKSAHAPFVVCPAWGNPPSYRLHVESNGGRLDALSAEFDAQLQRINREYASKRSSARLGPIVLNRLPSGFLATFDRRRQAMRAAAKEQHKQIFLLTHPDADREFPLDPLRANVLKDAATSRGAMEATR